MQKIYPKTKCAKGLEDSLNLGAVWVPVTVLTKLPLLRQTAWKNPNPKRSWYAVTWAQVKSKLIILFSTSLALPPRKHLLPGISRLAWRVTLLLSKLRVTSSLPGIGYSFSTQLRKTNQADQKTYSLQHMQLISRSREAKNRAVLQAKTAEGGGDSADGRSAPSSGPQALLTHRQQRYVISVLWTALYCRGITSLLPEHSIPLQSPEGNTWPACHASRTTTRETYFVCSLLRSVLPGLWCPWLWQRQLLLNSTHDEPNRTKPY